MENSKIDPTKQYVTNAKLLEYLTPQILLIYLIKEEIISQERFMDLVSQIALGTDEAFKKQYTNYKSVVDEMGFEAFIDHWLGNVLSSSNFMDTFINILKDDLSD
jgi:hypothetical protein